jgi:DNA-binding LytR/AlgR family response regulator
MKYTCVAIDDEYPATQVVEAFIAKIPDVELVKSFTKADKALQFINDNEVDFIFLDIQMPEINGIEFIQNLRKSEKIIFTTAYDNYAVEGFKLNAIDYLLKPFSFDRFVQAVNKVKQIIDLEIKTERAIATQSTNDFISVKSDYKLHKIALDDIDYIEGLKAYISIFVNGKRVIVLESLKNLEVTLPSDRFIRIHKSYIVPINKIRLMDGNMLELALKKVPIGKSYKETVLKVVFKQD